MRGLRPCDLNRSSRPPCSSDEGFPDEGIETLRLRRAPQATHSSVQMKGSPMRGLRPLNFNHVPVAVSGCSDEGFPDEGIETRDRLRQRCDAVRVVQMKGSPMRGLRRHGAPVGGERRLWVQMKGSPMRGLRLHAGGVARGDHARRSDEGFPDEGIETVNVAPAARAAGDSSDEGFPDEGIETARRCGRSGAGP